MSITDETTTRESASTPPASSPRRTVGANLARFSGLYIWAAIVVLFAVWIPQIFLTPQTAISIAGDEAITAIVAIGLLFTLAAGGFDLSIGQNVGLSAIVVATLSTVGGWDPMPAALAAVATSTIVGVVNGFFVARVGINSLIATLGTTSILVGLTRIISDQQFRGPVPDELRGVTGWQPFGVPGVTVYALILAVVAWYALEHTPFGRKLYATGANPDAAFLAGVKTSRFLFVSFIVSGCGAGVAGVLLASKIGSVGPDIGPAYLLPCFAACFLGTTQLKPGRFNVWGTVVAILLLATGVKGLQLVGGEQWITDLFNGVALIGAVSISVVAARRAALGRRRRAAAQKHARADAA